QHGQRGRARKGLAQDVDRLGFEGVEGIGHGGRSSGFADVMWNRRGGGRLSTIVAVKITSHIH
ncbi:MAG TPA: hypothetical protein VEH84_00120, partial [Alphaproteobacteria bacterium]|nr:hypothetical protein [Alphaproteobacteria bacterium]